MKETPIGDRDGKQIKAFDFATNPTPTVSILLFFATAVSDAGSGPCNHSRCRIRIGVVQLHGEHLPDEKEESDRDRDGKLIERSNFGGFSLRSEHLDERKMSWEDTRLRKTEYRASMARALHVPRSKEEKT